MRESAKMIKRYVLNLDTILATKATYEKWNALQWKAWRKYSEAIEAHGGLDNISNTDYVKVNRQYYDTWRKLWDIYFPISTLFHEMSISYKGKGWLYI